MRVSSLHPTRSLLPLLPFMTATKLTELPVFLVAQGHLHHVHQNAPVVCWWEWMRNQICQSCGLRPGTAQITFFYAKYSAKEMAQKPNLTERGDSNLFEEPGNIRYFESYSEVGIFEANGFFREETKSLLYETSEYEYSPHTPPNDRSMSLK